MSNPSDPSNLSDIQILLNQIRERHYWTPKSFRSATIEELSVCFNGIGPERWSPRVRQLITRCLSFLEAAALPHDWSYSRPGNYWSFTVANLQLAYNGLLEAYYRQSKAIAFAAVAAGLLCQIFGYKGYPHKKGVLK